MILRIKKFWKFVFIAILCVVTIFSAAACNPSSEKENEGEDETAVIEGEYLFKDGTSQYKIVVPENAEQEEVHAAEELQLFFNEATGVKPEIITDKGLSYSESVRYLSVGETNLSEDAGVKADYEKLGSQGFVLETEGLSVFMLGARTKGTLYSVYEFLYRAFAFEVFSPDECYIESCTELPLYDFSVEDKPDIEYRLNGYGYFTQTAEAQENMYRLRINDNPVMGVGEGYVYTTHNSTKYFTKEQMAENGEWWMGTDGYQLCYTAHGNAEKLDQMQDVVLSVMQDAIENNPDKSSIAFMQEDKDTWCGCAECQKVISEHGGFETSTQILFVNEVARRLDAWMKENHPDREVKIVIYAYHKTTKAPVKQLEDGTFVPYSDDMIFEDNVAVYYAPITADYYYSFKDSKNVAYANIMKGWAAVSDNIYAWLYSTDFNDYLMFFDSFNSMQENYQFLVENHASMVFENTQYNNTNSTAFHVLKGYLNAKLGWNVNEDYEELIDRFFRCYFRDAADVMRELYDQMRLRWAYNMDFNGLTGNIYDDLRKTVYLPYSTLLQWEDLIEQAYAAIEPLQEQDAELYAKVANRIKLESISVRYAQISMYGGRYDSQKLLEMKKSFKKDAMDLRISNQREGGTMSSLYNSWGV